MGNPSGKLLAVGGFDGRGAVFDREGSLIWEARRQSCRIYTVRFSPDGTQLASTHDGEIVLWNSNEGREIAVLDELKDYYYSVDWSPDQTRLITGSTSSTSIWDRASGHVAIKLASGNVHSVRWNPDGKRVAAGIWNSGPHVWDATRGFEIEGTSLRPQP